MKEAAAFFQDYLVEDPETGHLVSGPSGSPENRFWSPDSKKVSICMGPTMDHQIINELLNACIQASEILQTDRELRELWSGILNRLAPVRIGTDGRIMEWIYEFQEVEQVGAGSCHPGQCCQGRFSRGLVTGRGAHGQYEEGRIVVRRLA